MALAMTWNTQEYMDALPSPGPLCLCIPGLTVPPGQSPAVNKVLLATGYIVRKCWPSYTHDSYSHQGKTIIVSKSARIGWSVCICECVVPANTPACTRCQRGRVCPLLHALQLRVDTVPQQSNNLRWLSWNIRVSSNCWRWEIITEKMTGDEGDK